MWTLFERCYITSLGYHKVTLDSILCLTCFGLFPQASISLMVEFLCPISFWLIHLYETSRDHNLPKHSSSYVDYLQQVWSCPPQVTTKHALFHSNFTKRGIQAMHFYCYGLNMSSAVKWFIASYQPPSLFHCFMGIIEHSSSLCVFLF